MKKYENLKYKANLFDKSPIEQITFNGRVVEKYGMNCFSNKLALLSGDAFDSLRDNRNPLERLAATQKYNKKSVSDEDVPMIEVPEDMVQDWYSLIPNTYASDAKYKRKLIDQYLETLSEENKIEAIKIMCKNIDNNDYSSFLDRDFDKFDEEEALVANEIIRFHIDKRNSELQYKKDLAELSNTEKDKTYNLLEQDNNIYGEDGEYYNPYDKKSFSNGSGSIGMHPWAENNSYFDDEGLNFDKYKTLRQSDINNLRSNSSRLNQLYSNSSTNSMGSFNQFKKPLDQNRFRSSTFNQTSNSSLNLNKIPGSNIGNKIYTSPIARNTYNNIGNIPNCYNIVDLINTRNEVAHRNAELNKKIVSDSININSLVVTNLQNIGANNAKTNKSSGFNVKTESDFRNKSNNNRKQTLFA